MYVLHFDATTTMLEVCSVLVLLHDIQIHGIMTINVDLKEFETGNV